MLEDLSVGQNKCLAQVSISENIADDTNTDTDRREGNVRFFYKTLLESSNKRDWAQMMGEHSNAGEIEGMVSAVFQCQLCNSSYVANLTI